MEPVKHLTPPEKVTLWYCPVCGRLMTGLRTYGIDERRKTCSKTIHRAIAQPAEYVRLKSGHGS